MTGNETTPTSSSLFQHSKRPQWGLAIMAWNGPDKRGYQFQDGKLRVFKKGFYQFLVEVDRPADQVQEVLHELHSKMGVSEARKELLEEANAKGEEVFTLQDQIKAFHLEYPGGFHGQAWMEQFRPEDQSRALKRHRDAAVALAEEKLSPEFFEAALEAGDYLGIYANAMAVLDQTDMASPSHLKVLKELPDDAKQAWAVALYGLLYREEDSIADRFDAYVSAHLVKVPWQLITVPLALLYPQKYVPIQPSNFRLQAKWMAPQLNYSPTPNGALYRRFLRMAASVKEQLEKGDETPRDFIDIYDFIRLTLRPSARKRVKAPVEQ